MELQIGGHPKETTVELVDVVNTTGRGILLWILIGLTSLRLIVSWCLETIIHYGPSTALVFFKGIWHLFLKAARTLWSRLAEGFSFDAIGQGCRRVWTTLDEIYNMAVCCLIPKILNAVGVTFTVTLPGLLMLTPRFFLNSGQQLCHCLHWSVVFSFSCAKTVLSYARHASESGIRLGFACLKTISIFRQCQDRNIPAKLWHFTIGYFLLILHRGYNVSIETFRSRFPGVFNFVATLVVSVVSPCCSHIFGCLGSVIGYLWRIFIRFTHILWLYIIRSSEWLQGVAVGFPRYMDIFCSRIKRGEFLTSVGTVTCSRIIASCMDIEYGCRTCQRRLGCLASMSTIRMPHMRCNPRHGFIAIILFVILTFLVTTYLYSSGAITINKWDEGLQQGRLKEAAGGRLKEVDGRDQSSLRASFQNVNVDSPAPLHVEVRKEKKKGKKKEEPVETPGDSADLKQFSDVINLMARNRSPNETFTVATHRETLNAQIKVLKDAMLSKMTMLAKLDKPPACIGNLQPGEVEDILCIPRPKYLSYIKNPCWYGPDPSYPNRKLLRCLPYFHILGTAKAGTTDLWNRLSSHPHMKGNNGFLHKESLWWSWRRYGFSGYKKWKALSFEDYVKLYQEVASDIQSSMDMETLDHQILITGDASPPDFWDFRGWPGIAQNRNFTTPRVITPHLMKHMYVNPKFIVMFRDPIDRLYSDYFFVGGGLTSQDFHNDILATIDLLARCVSQHGLQRCFFDNELYMKLPVRLHFACYSVFMREWLQVFPLENFLFIKTEMYEASPEETLKAVMEFLGLGPLKDEKLELIAEEEKARVTLQRQVAGPMKNATKEILQQLLDPCSKELASLINRPEFVWGS